MTRPTERLMLLWLISAILITCGMLMAFWPAFYAALGGSVIAGSVIGWRDEKILAPARMVARAFCLENGPVGACCRDLAEAVFRWDKRA